MPEFNVMEHQMVPEHHLLSEKEAEELMKKYNITRDLLPKILRDDAAIRFLERVEGEIRHGRIIKIVRQSEISGVTVSYRIVHEG